MIFCAIITKGGRAMIIELRVNNYKIFNEKASLSTKADLRNKKFAFNVFRDKSCNVLKSLVVFGPNNVGKTCMVQCIKDIKNVLDNVRPLNIMPNLFTKNTVSELGITFLSNGRVFSYDFKYDVRSKEFIYECFAEQSVKSKSTLIYFKKDFVKNDYVFKDNEEIEKLLSVIGRNNILIYLIDTAKFAELAWIKEVLVGFSKIIDVVSMDDIPIQKTIDILKSKNPMKQKIVEFIKNADLDLDNFEYNRNALKKLKIEMNMPGEELSNMEAALKAQKNLLDQLCLVSRHKGMDLPSVLIDSTGTKKIVALASYVIEAIEQGRILVVDELDSSLHFKLTRAIVALFNNEVNACGQLICTIHDISLLDCKKLFRKEQIWFIHRDTEKVWLYSLSEFKARDHGTRDTTDIIEHYKKGLYGALPEPNLINTLLGV